MLKRSLLLVLIGVCSCELVQLSLKNYTQSKKEFQPIAVLYFGEDRASQKFLPEFLQIANRSHPLQQNSNFPESLNFGLVNSTAESKLMEKTQISGLPTVFLFFGDEEKTKYQGGLNAQAFINWVKKAFRDNPKLNEFFPSSLISKWNQMQNKFSSFNLVAILITPDFRLAPLKAFVQAARQLPEGFVFCHIHDFQIYSHLGIAKEESAMLVYSRLEDRDGFDEEAEKKWKTYMVPYKGDVRNQDEILKFLQTYSFKGFFYVDDTKFQKLSRRKDLLPTIMLLYNKTIPEHMELVEKVKYSRHPLIKKAILGVIDVDGDLKDRMDRIYNLNITDPDQIPRFIAIKPKNDNEFLKYRDNIMDPIQYYEEISQGRLTPYYRDEGVLEDPYDKAGIFKLTRTTYYPHIKAQNEKAIDVVVMYTAKKCAPCKDFRPDYNEVFKTYKSSIENKVQFTRVDIELNEIDNIYIENYPHVRLYKAGVVNPLTLYGEKSDKGLLKWLRENSNYPEAFQVKSDL